MKYVAVLPSIYQPWTDECMASIKFPVLLVDNTKDNIGSVAAWNLGVDRLREDKADWLIVVGASMRFGKPGGRDFIDALKDHPDFIAVEAEGVFGWHLIAFSRDCIENVGKFDANFFPYGFDDIDYSLRIQKHYWPTWPNYPRPDWKAWTKVPGEWDDAGMGHGTKLGGVYSDAEPLLAYYRAKWGGDKGDEQFDRPFNNPDHTLAYWPETRGYRWDA